MHQPYLPKSPDEEQVEEYWSWFAVALFLLLTVDLLTSVGAALEVGLQAEINPLMRWLLGIDLVAVTVVHLLVLVVAVLCFAGMMHLLGRTSNPIESRYSTAIEVWLGVLVAGGLFIFANNLSVIVHGTSLL